MNTAPLISFVALMVLCVFAAPIDHFTEGDAFQSRSALNTTTPHAERSGLNTTVSNVARNDYPSAGDVVLTFYARNGDSCTYFLLSFLSTSTSTTYFIPLPLSLTSLIPSPNPSKNPTNLPSLVQQTFPVDGNNYVIDNPLKIAKIVAEGTGYCAVTGYSGSFTQTQNTCGPLTVSPISVQVWGQCSTALPAEGYGLDVRPN